MPERSLFNILNQNLPGLVWISDSQGRLRFINAEWTGFTGISRHSALEYGWLEAIHPADAAAFRARFPAVGESGISHQFVLRIRSREGRYHRHVLSVRYSDEGLWVGCAINAHDWLKSALRDEAPGKILERVTSGVDLCELLDELCLLAERQIPGAICSIILVDAAKGIFTGIRAPKLPEHVIRALTGSRIGTGVGSCGTAAFEKRDVISSDIASDPFWDNWRHLLLPLGLRACWSQPVFSSAGEVIATFGFYFSESRTPDRIEIQDLSRIRSLATVAIERARMLEALRESEAHYRHTVEQNPQVPWTADPMGNLLSFSSRWAELTGIPEAEALGDGWTRALHPDDVKGALRQWHAAVVTGQPLLTNYRIRLQSGAFIWMRARATARLDADGRVIRWYGSIEDIHEVYLATEMLRRQAYHDDLTGLPNRRSFTEELKASLQAAPGPVGLMVLDMDDFKQVNERYGHQTGDAVLRLLARHLQKLAPEGAFVARMCGDEFAIILRYIAGERELFANAAALEHALRARLRLSKKTRACRPSIGCAVGGATDNPDELFKRAGLALFAAKETGKGSVSLFDPHMQSAAARRRGAFDLARQALREDWIEPFYQPILDLKSQRLRGFEALLRIRHPEQGILPPAVIMEALDDPRLADSIGMHMTRRIVADMAPDAPGGPLKGQVSINLATENIVHGAFVDNLLALLKRHNVARQALKLEITERVLIDRLGPMVIARLSLLRESGIGIALDDFGTGYASLFHLKRLPVDEIKIDRSFVAGLGTPENKGEIVQAMLGLARALGLSTVGEGVETELEARSLTEWGCDFGQGYLFGHPLPVAQARLLDCTGRGPR